MKSTRVIGILLAFIMMLSLTACGAVPTADAASQSDTPAQATDAPEAPQPTTEEVVKELEEELSDFDVQLNLIYDQIGDLEQKVVDQPWYYTVTDLDHNGRLEFIAASQHPQDRSTNMKIWEVSEDRSKLEECSVKKDSEETFPDIMTDSADTYHIVNGDSWYYLFYDNVVLSDSEVYTSKSSFTFSKGVLSYEAYAVAHVLVENNMRNTTFTDINGNDLTRDQYNAAGDNAFSGAGKSSTSFEWLKYEDLKTKTKLIDSFAVFMGNKKATETFPVPKPVALEKPEAPADTKPLYLLITKNPTNENKKTGETAYFVALANAYDWLEWTFVSPDGTSYTPQQIANMWADASIDGFYSTTLSIGNVATDMTGWGAYCTFYYNGQTGRTSTAYLTVKEPKKPDTGSYDGTVTSWNYSTINFRVEGGNLTLSSDICDIDGDLYEGAPATLYWTRDASGNENFTYVTIQGEHKVGPIYGSMSGTITDMSGNYSVYLDSGDTVSLSSDVFVLVSGDYIDVGNSCIVYYQNYPGPEMIYEVDVYGSSNPDPQPVGPIYGTCDGIAHEGGGGYAIDIVGGDQVYVDSSTCEFDGTFSEGCSCLVYYQNYPRADYIYKVDFYGTAEPIIGGDAGVYHGG